MIYLDTSIAIPIFLREAASSEILDWLDTPKKDLIAADWIVTEFASALFVKSRRGDVAQESARSVWESFDRFCRGGLRLIPVTRSAFARGADLVRNAQGALRAGDALHLAMALEVGVAEVATADEQFEQSAAAHGLTVTRF